MDNQVSAYVDAIVIFRSGPRGAKVTRIPAKILSD